MLGAMIWMDLFKKVHVKQLYKQQKEKSDLRRELEYVVTKKDLSRKKTPPKASYRKEDDRKKEELKRNREAHGKVLDFYIEKQINVYILYIIYKQEIKGKRGVKKEKKVYNYKEYDTILTPKLKERYEDVLNKYINVIYTSYRIYEKRLNEDIVWDNDFEGGYNEYLKKRLVNLKFEDKINVMTGFITSDIYMHIKQYKEHLKPKYLKKLNRGLKNDDLPDIYENVNSSAALLQKKELSYKEGILRLQRWVRFYIF